MKNKYKISFVLIASVLLLGCDDFLDTGTLGYPDETDFYQNINELQSGLNAVYSTFYDDDYETSEWLFGEGCGDMVSLVPGAGSVYQKELMRLETTPQNTLVENRWNINYKGIYRANWVIYKAPKVLALYNEAKSSYYADADSGLVWSYESDAQFFPLLLGEAKYLRALFYFNLVKTFGAVPLKEEYLTIDGDESNFIQARSPIDSVWLYIEKDLREAIVLLNSTLDYTSDDKMSKAKAKKGSAVGLLMKALAYQSTNGQPSEKWTELVKWGRFLVDKGNKWNPTYAEVLKIDEIYHGETWTEIKARLCLSSSTSSTTVTPSPASVYSDGLNLRYDKIYKMEGEFFSGSLFEINHIQVDDGVNKLGSNYYNSLSAVNNDNIPITPKVIMPVTFNWISKVTNDPRYRYAVHIGSESIPDYPGQSPYVGADLYGCMKWYMEKDYIKGQKSDYPKNYTIMRFADALLLYAEALNETGDMAGACEQLNRLHPRVNRMMTEDNIKTYYDLNSGAIVSDYSVSNYFITRSNIRLERQLELCYDNDRFFDIVRSGQAKEAFAAYNGKSTLSSWTKNFVVGVSELFPIPQTEIDLSGGVVIQNPGY